MVQSSFRPYILYTFTVLLISILHQRNTDTCKDIVCQNYRLESPGMKLEFMLRKQNHCQQGQYLKQVNREILYASFFTTTNNESMNKPVHYFFFSVQQAQKY